jgi:predicted ester cyclase
MTTNEAMSQIEMNKAVIQRYFEAYNNKDESIFDEIIAPEYVDHGQSAYMGSPGIGVAGAKRDLRYSLNKLDDLNYIVEAIIASEAYPDLVGAYWKGSLTPKAIYSDIQQTNKPISYRGVSIYRVQNGKIAETWHVFDGLPLKA